MSQEIQIHPLNRTPREVLRFLKVSYGIYRDDPHWVAPLLDDLKKVFTVANPLFTHADMQLWVAVRDGRDVGRIAGIVDHNHNRVQQDSAAFFGFFECIHDRAVSERLFAEVCQWAKARNLRRVLGPMNPTTNDEAGLLVDGFDAPPVFMMTYNPRYYLELLEAAGCRKTRDLLAFHVDVTRAPLDRLDRLADRVRKRHPELTFKPLRKRTLTADLAKVLPADKKALIVAYCANPHCGAYARAAEAAAKLGYTNVQHFKPGIQGWVSAGEPTDK